MSVPKSILKSMQMSGQMFGQMSRNMLIVGNGRRIAVVFIACLIALTAATAYSMRELPRRMDDLMAASNRTVYSDRYGQRLNVTYENRWNLHDRIRIHEAPELLQQAFIISEDKRFFRHHGVDWIARVNAAWQNIVAGRTLRGASTITEQVVRMIHPRPRTLWSRWVEGYEAYLLEWRLSKLEILEFYLNQVPYKARRRGVVQAARYYFDRDIGTLNEKEILALAVLVRSPKWLDPGAQIENLDRAITDLARRLKDIDEVAVVGQVMALTQSLIQSQAQSQVDTHINVQHFIEYINGQHRAGTATATMVSTTLDAELQIKAQRILDTRLQGLSRFNVNNGAVLIVDHETNEIRAWVSGFAGQKQKRFNQINPVVSERQPGSTLKPLLYARALERGWTAATMLNDSPLEEGVGLGMHAYHNYSRGHYGLVSVREALGNSLNIPAVKAVQFIGPEDFLGLLHNMGVNSLSYHPNVYGDGLALGNGEITLLELVQAYTVLARMGDFKPLAYVEGEHLRNNSHRVLSEDIASLVADIMSDPAAREKEFGWDSILNFPYQTAVKTGTSSDYRDAWAIGFNDHYTVGVWVGNLDYAEMDEITGSTGPAFVLRSVFNELNRDREIRPLYFSERLIKQRVCIDSGRLADADCKARDEWFVPGTSATDYVMAAPGIRLRKPSHGLLMAMDPRIPDEYEYFEFKLTDIEKIQKVDWFVNGAIVGTTANNAFNWRLSRGSFVAKAEIWLDGEAQPVVTDEVKYIVN